MLKSKLDTSNELFVCRYANGVKLVKPEQVESLSSIMTSTSQTVGDLLRLPMAVYFSDANNISVKCNEISALECGYDSCNDIVGKPWYHYFKSNTIALPIANSNEIIQKNITKIVTECAIRKDGSCNEILTIKMPWYDNRDKIVGVFGCAIILNQHPLAESLTQLAILGFLNSNQIIQSQQISGSKINSVYLTKREKECLQLTIRGKTAKHIAKILNLSHWTIEEYLANIKNKFGVQTKSELIDVTHHLI